MFAEIPSRRAMAGRLSPCASAMATACSRGAVVRARWVVGHHDRLRGRPVGGLPAVGAQRQPLEQPRIGERVQDELGLRSVQSDGRGDVRQARRGTQPSHERPDRQVQRRDQRVRKSLGANVSSSSLRHNASIGAAETIRLLGGQAVRRFRRRPPDRVISRRSTSLHFTIRARPGSFGRATSGMSDVKRAKPVPERAAERTTAEVAVSVPASATETAAPGA